MNLVHHNEGGRRMHKQEQGFTLLEAAIALVLFCLLLQGLLNFFAVMYSNSKHLEQKAYLMDNARAINNFIGEKIKEATNVEIELTKSLNNAGTPNDPTDDTWANADWAYRLITPILIPSDNTAREGRLSRIVLQDKVGNITYIDLKFTSSADNNKGYYQLVYVSGTSATESLISDRIQNIKVTRKKDSDIVEFSCELSKKNETFNYLKIKEVFTESLAYKGKVVYPPGP